jgi:hypothetical protein
VYIFDRQPFSFFSRSHLFTALFFVAKMKKSLTPGEPSRINVFSQYGQNDERTISLYRSDAGRGGGQAGIRL